MEQACTKGTVCSNGGPRILACCQFTVSLNITPALMGSTLPFAVVTAVAQLANQALT